MAMIATQSTPVLHLLDALLCGGAERLAVELAIRTSVERFSPALACFRQEAFADELAAAGRPVHVVPKRRAFDLGLLLALRRLLRREHVAVVHAHDLQSATYGLMAGRLARAAVVLTVHGLGIFRQARSARLLPFLARRADRMVFVGHWLERFAIEEFGLRPRHPVVVHNGVDVGAFCPGAPDPVLRDELGIPADARVVGTVGNLRAVKDYPCLVRAFAAARARVPDAALVFVGDGEERPRLEALARELDVADAVCFAGARTDVPRLLRLFDVFALSSQTEGISVALLEAMATGLPAAVTDTGGNPEVVERGRTGLLAPVGDSEQLGAALADLLADPNRCAAFGSAARERVEQEFSLGRMVREYESLYDAVGRR